MRTRTPIYREASQALEPASGIDFRNRPPDRLPNLRNPFDDSGHIPRIELRF